MTTGVWLMAGIKSLAFTQVSGRREKKSLIREVRRRKMLLWQESTLTGWALQLSLDSSDKRWRRISTMDVRVFWWNRSNSIGKWLTSLRPSTGTAGTAREVSQCRHLHLKLQNLLLHCQRLPGTPWRLGVTRVRLTRGCLSWSANKLASDLAVVLQYKLAGITVAYPAVKICHNYVL